MTKAKTLLALADRCEAEKPSVELEPIMDSGFQTGPQLLFDNCRRIAREALRRAALGAQNE